MKKIHYILLLGLALRLTVFFILQPWTEQGREKILRGDANGYHHLAVEIKEQGTFGATSPFLSALRTPGYPGFIAFWYLFFGTRPWLVILVQIALDTILIATIFWFVKEILNQTVALIAALLYALDPLAIQYTNVLLSDSLFVFFIFISYVFLWKFLKEQKYKHLVLSAILIGIACYVRPIGLYLIIPNSLFLLFFVVKKRLQFKPIVSYMFLFGLILLPWMTRNYHKHDHFFFSTSGNFNLLILYASDVEAEAKNVSTVKLKQEYRKELSTKFPNVTNENIYDLHQQYKQKAFSIFLTYHGALIKSYVRGIVDMFFSVNRGFGEMIIGKEKKIPYDAFVMLKQNGLTGLKIILIDYPISTTFYAGSMLLWFFLTYITTLLGFHQLIINKKWPLLLFILIPIIYFFLITGQAGNGRFKLPIIPFYLILSAIGLQRILHSHQVTKTQRK